LLNLDLAQLGEIVDDALPLDVAVVVCRETIHQLLPEDEGEEGAKHMAADAGVGLVEDRSCSEQRLCGFEGILHSEQVAITQDHLERGDFGVGAQHEQTIEAGVGLDPGLRRGKPWRDR